MQTIIGLWRHKESRAILMQILAVSLVFALIAYFTVNAYQNLETLGQDVDYGFLDTTAGYDIPTAQQLIAYDSTMSHGRAALVGILNTLLVAVTGIALATLIGFVVGILRLSKNYLVSGLARIYVEVFRNVPILLWILLFHGVIVHNLPIPKQAISLWDSLILTNRGFYFPEPIFDDRAIYSVIALVIGFVMAIFYARRAKRIQIATGKISPVLWVSIGLIIGLPLVVFALSGFPFEWDMPVKKGFNYQGGMVIKPEYTALWLALSLYTASFIAENVRAGILAVSHGQTEAAFSLGLKPTRTMQLIIIPQAMRVIVPPTTNQYLNLTKNSSLAIAVGYMDIMSTLGGITLNQTGRAIEAMSLALLIYLVISLLISLFMNWYNKRIKLVER